jgi:uncharacterized protein YwgA
MTPKAKLAACLEMFGISPRLETFTERKLLQKLVYLIQESGVDLKFCYNWYLHGPYSPGLTRILFERDRSSSLPRVELSAPDIDRINRLKSFLGEDVRSSDRLELIVSIHYLLKQARAVGASDRQVTKTIKEVKPYFSDEEIRQCWQKAIQLNSI